MKKGNKNNRRLFIDGNGAVWTEDGMFVMDDNEPGSLHDFVNRTCAGEDPDKALKACELARKRRQERIELARKTGKRVEL